MAKFEVSRTFMCGLKSITMPDPSRPDILRFNLTPPAAVDKANNSRIRKEKSISFTNVKEPEAKRPKFIRIIKLNNRQLNKLVYKKKKKDKCDDCDICNGLEKCSMCDENDDIEHNHNLVKPRTDELVAKYQRKD